MRRFLAPVLVLLLVVSGCAIREADSPRERLAVAAAAYETAVVSVTALAAEGRLDLAAAERFEHIRVHARAALDAARRVLGDPRRLPADALYYVDEAARLVQQLVAIERARRAG